ncbi:MAG: YkgJ family cysteine cluster protein [Bryobacterales bacterium]|nr:YkgJ family cysteine cluster protein [Bryobacterales bacterium]
MAEVFRLGTEKAEENLAFRRYLAERHYPEGPFQILANEVQKEIDCTVCANCCKHSTVDVTPNEIEQIARHLGTTARSVTELYTVANESHTGRELKSDSTGCVFLNGNLCTIYDARPTPCRQFPHIAPGSHTLGGRHSSHGRWAALCPIIYNALEAYKATTGFRKGAPPK